MKHHLFEEVSSGAEALGLRLPAPVAEAIGSHLSWLLEMSERVNLTSVTEPTAAVRLHVLDSLAALEEVAAGPAGRAVDIGTGGGFPGVPLALASNREFTLLDSVQKKANLLREYLSQAGVANVRVLGIRSEELAVREPAAFSLVLARAVTSLSSLVELSSPLLREGGWLIALKGTPSPEEVQAGVDAGHLVGMCMRSRRDLSLPTDGEARSIFVFERRGKPRVALPRRVGLAQKKPLA